MFTLLSGKDRACTGKHVYETLEDAERAASAHNRWDGRDHDVEPYQCPHCHKFHKGRKMAELVESLIALARSIN